MGAWVDKLGEIEMEVLRYHGGIGQERGREQLDRYELHALVSEIKRCRRYK